MKFVGLSGIGILVCSVLSIAGTATDPAESFDLTFEARVRAQSAIERVFHSHRIDAAEDFETAVPREVLGARVRRFLRVC